MSKHWTANDIPDQQGRIAIVTGANSGIGYETARALVAKGAQVIMACRNEQKAESAAQKICDEGPRGTVDVMCLDLADLASVHQFTDEFKRRYGALHLLINNAGVMALPKRYETADGFEMQFGTNHLGHFALTGRLLDKLTHTPGARVVNVSSFAHKLGRMNFDDLNAKRRYQAWIAYCQSKLANLLFTYELQRRFEAAGVNTTAAAAHPGWTNTNLQKHSGILKISNPFFGQSPAMGALPTLYAAVGPDVTGGSYYGAGGLFELRGYPKRVRSTKASHDRAAAARLWALSEELTGVVYSLS